jgi:gas vesicle structural protein
VKRRLPGKRHYVRVPPVTRRHTTIPEELPPREPRPAKPAARAPTPKPVERRMPWAHTIAPKHRAGRLIDPEDATMLDVIDNLLNKGVVLNADLILALANVDLVYIRLTALLCATDRLKRGPRR